jgi:lysozyme
MNISDNGISLIKRFEGLVLTAYPDPGTGDDPWTIGYGHTGPDVHPGLTITQESAEGLLRGDLMRFEAGIANAATPCSQGQFDALVSFAFNLGLKNLLGSTLLRLHRAGDYAGAAAQFSRWTRAAGRVMPGLVKRRAAEAELYAS